MSAQTEIKAVGIRGRPRSSEKNQSILAAASNLFLENGFDNASMDEIARRACVSKQTVYGHFSNKEQLFSEAIRLRCEEYFPDTVIESIDELPLREGLSKMSLALGHMFVSDDAISVFRLLSSTAAKDDKLAKLFWAAGPEIMIGRLKDYLDHWVVKGELEIKDVTKAAIQLISLLKGIFHFRLAIGLISHVSDEEVEDSVVESVDAFLKIYRKV